MGCEVCAAPANVDKISVAAHETALAREDKKNQRLVIVIIVLVISLVAVITGAIFAILHINKKWLDTWNSYDFTSESTEIMQDGEGIKIYGSGNRVMQNESENPNNP